MSIERNDIETNLKKALLIFFLSVPVTMTMIMIIDNENENITLQNNRQYRKINKNANVVQFMKAD